MSCFEQSNGASFVTSAFFVVVVVEFILSTLVLWLVSIRVSPARKLSVLRGLISSIGIIRLFGGCVMLVDREWGHSVCAKDGYLAIEVLGYLALGVMLAACPWLRHRRFATAMSVSSLLVGVGLALWMFFYGMVMLGRLVAAEPVQCLCDRNTPALWEVALMLCGTLWALGPPLAQMWIADSLWRGEP